MGLREQIKAASVRKPLKVHVKDWNLDVYVRVLSVGERDAWELSWVDMRSKGMATRDNFRAFYLIRALCDEHGVRLYQDSELDEVASLDGAVMSELFDVAQRHNKLSEADVVELAGEL
jgi:regulatory protein YycI of two-component signal transduction system YycFG